MIWHISACRLASRHCVSSETINNYCRVPVMCHSDSISPTQNFAHLCFILIKKGKGFPHSLPIVEPGADPGVQAVSPQVTISHPLGGRLPLLFARPAVTFPAADHHRPLASTKLYCLVTEAHRCEQLAQGCYATFAPSTI